MTRHGSILVIDDEEIMREILETLLVREGYQVRLATNGTQGIELARSMPFDAAIVDVMMPGIDGIATLEELKTIDEDLPVVMVTAFASIETAIAAMKRGALDYITKPFKNDEVLIVLRNALERRQLVTENRALRQNLQTRYHKFANIIGRSPRMRQVFDLIIQAAPSRSTVLVNGESGTGKELVARALHTNSPRADRNFVSVNSGNLPPDLLESNLFGHVKGAFTGAVYPKKGLFEVADKGSIFFDVYDHKSSLSVAVHPGSQGFHAEYPPPDPRGPGGARRRSRVPVRSVRARPAQRRQGQETRRRVDGGAAAGSGAPRPPRGRSDEGRGAGHISRDRQGSGVQGRQGHAVAGGARDHRADVASGLPEGPAGHDLRAVHGQPRTRQDDVVGGGLPAHRAQGLDRAARARGGREGADLPVRGRLLHGIALGRRRSAGAPDPRVRGGAGQLRRLHRAP